MDLPPLEKGYLPLDHLCTDLSLSSSEFEKQYKKMRKSEFRKKAARRAMAQYDRDLKEVKKRKVWAQKYDCRFDHQAYEQKKYEKYLRRLHKRSDSE